MAKYPTKMHEILGVETDNPFKYQYAGVLYNLAVNSFGQIYCTGERIQASMIAPSALVCQIINFPEGIIREPRLTSGQVLKLKALYELGMRWLVKTCSIYATPDKPYKGDGRWQWHGPSIGVDGFTDCLDTLNCQDPLNIAQTLEANETH